LLVLSLIFCTSLFAGCAFDLVRVKQIPAELDTTQHSEKSFKLVDDVKVKLNTSYERELKGGTNWNYVGQIQEGNVYKTNDQVLTVEGSNIFEAYIVLSGDKLIGFYLPVEKTFCPLAHQKKLQVDAINSN